MQFKQQNLLLYSAAFGEFYIELHDIYEGLVAVCLSSGNALRSSSLLESAFYLKKVRKVLFYLLRTYFHTMYIVFMSPSSFFQVKKTFFEPEMFYNKMFLGTM